MKQFKKICLIAVCIVTPIIIAFVFWIIKLEREVQQSLSNQWFVPPIEIYSAPQLFTPGLSISPNETKNLLVKLRLNEKAESSRIREGEFSQWPIGKCQAHLSLALPMDTSSCIVFKSLDVSDKSHLHMITYSEIGKIDGLFSGEPLKSVSQISFRPVLFAQYYGEKPILRRVVKMAQIPLYCAQAVTAIEDKNFLLHKGFSPFGFVRAIFANLLKGRFAQGGSTITQQLVKNYFLTPEKTIKRKITEILMAMILEAKIEKEVILENYLNVNYMGQNGPFEVRGFGASARHYFNKELEELNLSECALLAAVLNNPGRYNPFNHTKASKVRRTKVLNHMLEQNLIDEEGFKQADESPLPQKPPQLLTEPAPYYVQAVFRELKSLNYTPEQLETGLRVYTYLDPKAQELALQAVRKGLSNVTERFKSLTDLKKEGKELQGLLVSSDLTSGGVIALIGGNSYKKSQYNRVLDSRRQVGSVMKPFVYLSALENKTPNGDDYTPLTTIDDSSFNYKYEGQSWSPSNYENKFFGSIPLFWALKNSVNVSTAKLGLAVGLNQIIDVARRAGIQAKLDPLPSITLGAFEITPLELLESYSTLARMGVRKKLAFIRQIRRLNDELVYEHEANSSLVFAPEVTAVLVGMLKQTLISGTARSSSAYGFNRPAAGKTGTTSDTKDAWFSGFTPNTITLTWVGFDDNTPHGLTGASGALPIWLSYMLPFTEKYLPTDFEWPEGVTNYHLDPSQINELIPEPNEFELKGVDLIFRKGNEPQY